MSKKNIKKLVSTKAAVRIILALAVLSTLAVGGIYAKYVKSGQTQGSAHSPDFYFTGDILGTPTAQNPFKYTLNPGSDGTTEISFDICNFADELRISDDDIAFSVSVTPSEGVTVKVGDAVTATGTLGGGSASSAKVTVSGLKNGETYQISATADAGFVSTISATVTVKATEGEIYKHLDVSATEYVLLTVWTTNLAGDARIDFPAGLIPDATDGVMSGVYNYSEGSYIEDSFTDGTSFDKKYSSHVYRFFKTTDTEYTVDNFTVSIGDVEASEGSPE